MAQVAKWFGFNNLSGQKIMSKIRQQFLDFRQTTPKYIQWLLLLAALVSVVVLIVLLMDQKKTERARYHETKPGVPPKITIMPADEIDWVNTSVGDLRTEQLSISSNTRVQIDDVVPQIDNPSSEFGISIDSNMCTGNVISPESSCFINIGYRPIGAIPLTDVDIDITWHDIDTGVGGKDIVKVALSAVQEYNDPIYDPEPIDEPEQPEPDPEPSDAPEPYIDPGYALVPPVDFEPEPPYNPAPAPVPAPTQNRPTFTAGTGCSDFAFPAYNNSGTQSGWIKPVGGGYYFYPLADANCEHATGIYNPDSGIVMDISNPTHKIASDAEHIRLISSNTVPNLTSKSDRRVGQRSQQITLTLTEKWPSETNKKITLGSGEKDAKVYRVALKPSAGRKEFSGYANAKGVVSTRPYDRSFVLRQYKPIPATIVSDVQADSKLLESGLPVRATVDRNVYSDNGRTVIIPTGTLMLGKVVGELPGPYKAVGRMQIVWYQFIRPDGVEFNFDGTGGLPFAADSQGRKGVPGHGSTDYLQQFVMPMLTAIVPAAVNMIAPISDAFVNQIDLDNNTVVQTGTVRSSELAKNEIITAWNNVATKLMVDMMDNTTPPFSIAAGTRITVFSPVDLFVTCGADGTRACNIRAYPDEGEEKLPERFDTSRLYDEESPYKLEPSTDPEELLGQVRSLMSTSIADKCCNCNEKDKYGNVVACTPLTEGADYEKYCKQYSFATLDFYCRSFGTYEAINNAKQKALYTNQQNSSNPNSVASTTVGQTGDDKYKSKAYNEQVLGMTYTNDGKTLQNPFEKQPEPAPAAAETSVLTCDGGVKPDVNGCCPGETYTDMGAAGYNCCPDAGGDCFPPIK